MLGILAVLLIIGIFFLSYFRVEHVEVRGNTHYTDDEIKEMTLNGLFRDNSLLAPVTCSRTDIKDVFFVDSITVTQLTRDTIAINVMEKKSVGCIRYLDSYIYFDRNGIFVEGSTRRDEKVPFFKGIEVKKVIEDEKLPFKGTEILNTAVTLSTIFQKNQELPEYVDFDETSQIILYYDDIVVRLGENRYLEDKMARAIAILDQIRGQKGILHLESVTDTLKTITFEPEEQEITAENWNGGYDEYGDYTGYGEYDENGNHVGPKPMTELDYAQIAWLGGYDGEGDYTGAGEYDQYGNYVGFYPTQEDIDAHGDWKGGYTEEGGYNGTGEFDHAGNYVGPNPNADAGSTESSDGESSDDSSYEEEYGSEEEYYDDSYDEEGYSEEYWDDGSYDEEAYY